MNQPTLKTNTTYTVLIIYVVDPATSLASSSALGTLFPSWRSFFVQFRLCKNHICLCLYYYINFVNTLSLYFFCKNYFMHNSCQFPQHVKRARGRVSWRGAGLFKWVNRCSELVWTDGAGHLLCRAEPEDEEKVRETADKTHHFHSNHRIATCLQSAPSVRRRCISVSNGRFVCSHVF